MPRVLTPIPESAAPGGEDRKALRPRRVLVIEDNVDAAESMRAVLRTDHHEVEVVHDGAALAGRRPKLLALTGYGRDDDRQAALKAGFDGHLAKPVDPRLLLQIMAEPQAFAATTLPG